jgi:Tfp pilus assembly protein PilF
MVAFSFDGGIAASLGGRTGYKVGRFGKQHASRDAARTRRGESADDTRRALQHPLLAEAQWAIHAGRFRDAEHAAARYIAGHGRTTAAIMVLAAIPARQGRPREAAALLQEAVTRTRHLTEAQLALASLLLSYGAVAEGIAQLDAVLAHDPSNMAAALQRMWAFARTGDYGAARTACEALLANSPGDAGLWLSYGHLLKASATAEAAAAAYRRALAAQPAWGEPWWALANLKTGCLNARDIADMRQALARAQGAPADRVPLHFALGRALQDAGDFGESFRHLEQGNRLYRARSGTLPPPVREEVDAAAAVVTPAFLASRSDSGFSAPDPIFIVGMPRSGTTLVEHILACHSAVEGTAELPYISDLVQGLIGEQGLQGPSAYADLLAGLDPARLAAIGQDYLQRSAAHRHSRKPLFVDKMPSNWRYIAFIRLILPNARIVDVRRGAVDCCFSNFEQLFGGGHEFAYSLADLGHHYRAYARALDRARGWAGDTLINVSHKALVRAPEPTIRRLLDDLKLPFEDECLRFHESDRPVSTPSAQQVRQPIHAGGIGRWRPYAQWLRPLLDALGDLAGGNAGYQDCKS